MIDYFNLGCLNKSTVFYGGNFGKGKTRDKPFEQSAGSS